VGVAVAAAVIVTVIMIMMMLVAVMVVKMGMRMVVMMFFRFVFVHGRIPCYLLSPKKSEINPQTPIHRDEGDENTKPGTKTGKTRFCFFPNRLGFAFDLIPFIPFIPV
jgi:hypothetical protein